MLFFPKHLRSEIEYLNGKKNGKGKEYYYGGQLLFEGEYLNGKRWNGKFYNTRYSICDELKNGKGFIKKFYYSGQLRFECQYLKGEKMEKEKNII